MSIQVLTNYLLNFPAFLMLAILPLTLTVAALLQTQSLRRQFSPAVPLAGVACATLCAAVLAHVLSALLDLLAPAPSAPVAPATAWLNVLIAPGTVADKFAGFACLLLTYLLVALSVRQRFRGQMIPYITALGYFALLALLLRNYSWSAAESLVTFAAALGLYSCLLRPGRIAWLLCGIALGIAVSGKVTGLICFLPYLAWFFDRDGYRAPLVTLLAAAVVALLPFLFVEPVSWQSYLGWLPAAGNDSAPILHLIANLTLILFVLAPVGLFLLWQIGSVGIRSWFVCRTLVSAAAVLAALLILVAAAGAESGSHILQPFAPALAFLTAHAVSRVDAYRPTTGWSVYGFWAPLAAILIAAVILSVFALDFGTGTVNP